MRFVPYLKTRITDACVMRPWIEPCLTRDAYGKVFRYGYSLAQLFTDCRCAIGGVRHAASIMA